LRHINTQTDRNNDRPRPGQPMAGRRGIGILTVVDWLVQGQSISVAEVNALAYNLGVRFPVRVQTNRA
jgi:hypothetical protein